MPHYDSSHLVSFFCFDVFQAWITVFSLIQTVVFKTTGDCVRKFCFCARKRRLWKLFILLKKTLSLLCLVIVMELRKRRESVYSVTDYKQEYLAKYRDLIIQESSLEAHIIDIINRFVRIGCVDKGKSPERPSVSGEVVDGLRRLEENPQTSLTKFPQHPGVPVAAWNWTMCIDESITEHFAHFQHLLWRLTAIKLWSI